jgi:hypothetical protein
LYGERWFSESSIFRGVIQEQYYLLGQYAFDHLIIEEFSQGRFPLWNHLNALGTPFLGNMLSAVCFPLKAIIYAFPSDVTRDIYIILRLLIGAVFSLLLARRLGLSFFPSVVVALCFVFTGYMRMFINENYLNADLLLPGLVYFTLRLSKDRRFADMALLSVLIYAVINNGHPEAAFYTLLLPAFLAIVVPGDWKSSLRSVLLFGAAFTIGFVMSLPMLLPFLEYWSRGYHFHVPGAGFFHYSAAQVSSVVSPWFFGKVEAGAPFSMVPNISWPANLSGIPAYADSAVPWLFPSFGAFPFFLACLAIVQVRKLLKVETAMLAFSIFFMGVMFGLPLFRLAGLVPIFDLSGNFKHPLPAVALCVALLAGRGLDLIIKNKTSFPLVLNTLTLTLLFILVSGVFHDPLLGGPGFINKYSVLTLTVLTVAGAWLCCLSSFNNQAFGTDKLFGVITGTVAISASVFCLVLDGHQQKMRDPGYEKMITAGNAVSKLIEEPSLSRVYFSQDMTPPNMNILYGLADIRVMDGVNDKRFVNVINAINGHDRASAGTYWYKEVGYLQPKPDNLDHFLLDLLNVEYAVHNGPLPYNRTIPDVMSYAKTISPAKGYIGKAGFKMDGLLVPGLLQHPPSKIVYEISGPDAGNKIRLIPSILEEAIKKQTDGAWMSAFSGDRILYSRYIHPLLVPSDIEIHPQDFFIKGQDVTLSTLPHQSFEYDQVGWADLRIGPKRKFTLDGWTQIVNGKTRLYRNRESSPRIFLSGTPVLIGQDLALHRLAAGDLDPSKEVFVSGTLLPQGLESYSGRGLPGKIDSISYTSQRIEVEAKLWRSGWLVVGDLFYPGWQALDNENPVKIYQADYLLRGIDLEKGAHKIVMVYRPFSFRGGLWVFLTSLFIFILLISVRIFLTPYLITDVKRIKNIHP